MDKQDCIFCKEQGKGERNEQIIRQDCPRCGRWTMDAPTLDHLLQYDREHTRRQVGGSQMMSSQAIRRMQRTDEGFFAHITDRQFDAWAMRREPDPEEKISLALVWLGDRGMTLADEIEFKRLELCAEIAVWSTDDLTMVLKELATRGLIEERQHRTYITMRGWTAYHALKANPIETRTAFMAMKFDLESSFQMFRDCFAPAAKQTGFDLRRVDSLSRPGLIDVQMMVDIRAAAFVVADLTGASAGAYWEAGFASGLGKPVIYTCEEKSFSDSHFDTNHHVTIKWNAGHPERAASDLKAMIRNALPDRAKMTDD